MLNAWTNNTDRSAAFFPDETKTKLRIIQCALPRQEVAMKEKKVLVTAGSTIIPIDQVRVISNIFKGRTGTAIAQFFAARGYDVTLLTSNPEMVTDYHLFRVVRFRTFTDLEHELETRLATEQFDAIIHSAAVSDYRVSGVLFPAGENGQIERLRNDTKISSHYQNLYLELQPTPKLIDLFRGVWNYRGFLVKFKLEVDKSSEELIEIARKSRRQSEADLIVANCLEWARDYAYLLGADEKPEKVTREQIAAAIERRFICTSY